MRGRGQKPIRRILSQKDHAIACRRIKPFSVSAFRQYNDHEFFVPWPVKIPQQRMFARIDRKHRKA